MSETPRYAFDRIDDAMRRKLRERYPRHVEAIESAADEILSTLPGTDYGLLERRSPGLRGFDWSSYIVASALRAGEMLKSLADQGIRSGRLLDYGSYFGNVSLAARLAGFDVLAVDSYAVYGDCLRQVTDVLHRHDVDVASFEDVGYGLEGLDGAKFDVVLCLGVIEHIPHTPREALSVLDTVLVEGGVLVIDTPNLAYLYRRKQLAAGQTVFLPIELQYYTDVPFEGHHREYTRSEVEWMLGELGHDMLCVRMFNYSIELLAELTPEQAEDLEKMEHEPDMRELILTVSRKPAMERKS